jgi:large subunit ribosomal protein L17
MRHQVKGKKLSRDSSQRKALFKNLINALVIHGEIKTTESKAKAIRGLVDKLITKGKRGTFQARRLIGAFLQNKMAVNKIVDELSPTFKNRPGGFTKIVRLGPRRGDDAMMVKLELMEKPKPKEEKKNKEKEIQLNKEKIPAPKDKKK